MTTSSSSKKTNWPVTLLVLTVIIGLGAWSVWRDPFLRTTAHDLVSSGKQKGGSASGRSELFGSGSIVPSFSAPSASTLPDAVPSFVTANNPKGITFSVLAMPRAQADQDAQSLLDSIDATVPPEAWLKRQYDDPNMGPARAFSDTIKKMDLPEETKQKATEAYSREMWQADQIARKYYSEAINTSVNEVAGWLAQKELETSLAAQLSDQQFKQLRGYEKSNPLFINTPHPYDLAVDPNWPYTSSKVFGFYPIRSTSNDAVKTEDDLFQRVDPEKVQQLVALARSNEYTQRFALPDAFAAGEITDQEYTDRLNTSVRQFEQAEKDILQTREQGAVFGLETLWDDPAAEE
jgi:hypothetical protein